MNKTVLTIAICTALSATTWLVYRLLVRPVADVYVVQRGTAVSAVYGTVRVTPKARLILRAGTSGTMRLARNAAGAELAPGMPLEEGQLLGSINSPELERELTKSESDLKAAEERQRLGAPSLQLLKTSEANLARLEKLAAQQNAPASELERVRNEVQGLRERVTNEQVELERILTLVQQQAGAVRDRKARCEVHAPLTGVLTAVAVVTGDLIPESAAPFVVESKSAYLEGQVNEEDVGRLVLQQSAVVRLTAYPQQEFTATLTHILPGGDNQRYLVRLEFNSSPVNLLSGMTGEMNIVIGKREQALIIPSRALLGNQVWVVEDSRIKIRAVQTGLRSLERTEIVSGLRDGERVLVADHDLFRPGQLVRSLVVSH
ncbi:MAG: efflux RND transporter periplasmic adaptor subunit [Verrucomicrobiota bacterium]|jgi:RND family efflux transporter MFP subunit